MRLFLCFSQLFLLRSINSSHMLNRTLLCKYFQRFRFKESSFVLCSTTFLLVRSFECFASSLRDPVPPFFFFCCLATNPAMPRSDPRNRKNKNGGARCRTVHNRKSTRNGEGFGSARKSYQDIPQIMLMKLILRFFLV